jgi:uncharacterized protein DUF4242
MPRYLVQRTFTKQRPTATPERCRLIVAGNGDDVTWLHSYVSGDGLTWFCAYEAPTPEAIRTASIRNSLPIASITVVRVLDPYSYREH